MGEVKKLKNRLLELFKSDVEPEHAIEMIIEAHEILHEIAKIRTKLKETK